MEHEWQAEAYPETVNGPSILEMLQGSEYDGYPLRPMTLEGLLQHGANGGIVNYVWPYEGRVTPQGTWKFHTDTIMDGTTPVEAPKTPLLVDALSAKGFMLVYNAVNEANQAKTVELLKSRGLFCGIVMEKLVWPNVSLGGR
jgi:hypothetical protein